MPRFFRVPTPFTRNLPGARDAKGRWQEPAPVTVMIDANIQPVSGRSMSQLQQVLAQEAGLERMEGVLEVFSSQAVYNSRKSPSQRGDRFTRDGELYEIRASRRHGNLLPHYYSLATLVDEKTL